MPRYLAARTGTMLLALIAVSIGLFALIHAAPGDAADVLLPPDQEGAAGGWLEARRHELGLDLPLLDQYLRWAGQVLHGDLGKSARDGRPVLELLLDRLAPTLQLVGVTVVGSAIFALVLGFLAATRGRGAADQAIVVSTLLVMSVPAFFLGMLAMYVFSFTLGWLPTAGSGDLRHLVLPAGVLVVAETARLTRFVRAGLLEELNADYVRTALAKGASSARARMHALRNTLLPLISLLVVGVPELLGSTVVIEILFAWPGAGLLAVDAITHRDYPVVIGFGLVMTVLVLVGNMLGDLLYRLADPRVRPW